MGKINELKEIRDLIFQYKDTADKKEQIELKKILIHELDLLKRELKRQNYFD